MIETNKAAFRVAAGDAILLVPGMWHRYKPDHLTGRHEHWVGFAGSGAEQVSRPGLPKRKKNEFSLIFLRLRRLGELVSPLTRGRP